MARTLTRNVVLSRSVATRPAAGRLPLGYGLAIGATISIGLWAGIIKLAAGVFG